MHPIANHLIQLQELTLIREEQRVATQAGAKDHLEEMNASIKTMTEALPKDVRTHFEKMRKKDQIAIVPVANGICSGCGMQLAISYVQAVRMARELLACPNCARMLYCPESVARRLGKADRRFAPRKIGISRFSSHTLMIPRLAAGNLKEAIAELATLMESEGFVDKAEPLIEGALCREAMLSTVVDHGLAFPHVRGVEGGGLTLALGLSPKGLSSVGGGEALAHIVFFIVIPTAASAFYLKLLAGLTASLMNTDARKALLAESDQDKVWKTLTRITRATIK